ncbi:MAG: endolytic transglycosylase MltG [Desulfurivibrionaceae bacterium]
MPGKREKAAFNPYSVLIIMAVLALIIVSVLNLIKPFAAPRSGAGIELFTISGNYSETGIATRLKEENLIRNTWAFRLALKKPVEPGGYYLTRNMDAWAIAEKLGEMPDLVRLTIPEGWRREQIAELLSKKLGWSQKEKENWLVEAPLINPEIQEGLYFPDTYLIPRSESPRSTSRRLRYRFQEAMEPFFGEALQKNIKWTALVTLASIIEREASGDKDRKLIAGILWNRLQRGMKLDADATVQYIRDNRDDNDRWWGPIDREDKQIDSPYNTYKHKGLPPSPINSPGRAALEAALNPKPTEFLYYLHDDDANIHCARSYDLHRENIRRYLNNDQGADIRAALLPPSLK